MLLVLVRADGELPWEVGGVGELPLNKKYFCHQHGFYPLLDPFLCALAGESDLAA